MGWVPQSRMCFPVTLSPPLAASANGHEGPATARPCKLRAQRGPSQYLAWALLWSGVTAQDTICTPRDSFTPIRFLQSQLVRSNLGGLGSGGKCTENPLFGEFSCEELETESTTREIYIRNVGRTPEGVDFGIRIENATECIRTWGARPQQCTTLHAPSPRSLSRCLPLAQYSLTSDSLYSSLLVRALPGNRPCLEQLLQRADGQRVWIHQPTCSKD